MSNDPNDPRSFAGTVVCPIILDVSNGMQTFRCDNGYAVVFLCPNCDFTHMQIMFDEPRVVMSLKLTEKQAETIANNLNAPLPAPEDAMAVRK